MEIEKMIKIGDKVKVTGTGGLYTTSQSIADRLCSKLYKSRLYPNKMLFEVIAMGEHQSRIVFLLKNEDGEFLFDAADSLIEVITKPHTKTEFVKVEYNHAWEIIKLYEDGEELFKTDSDELQIERINSIALRAQAGYPFYRKVETEIDERQEFIEAVIGGKGSDGYWFNGVFVSSDVAGVIFDSGKVKLVEK